jgi:hypothetical protein
MRKTENQVLCHCLVKEQEIVYPVTAQATVSLW